MELKYRPEIDGLRTIAVLSVIVYHAQFSFRSGHLLKGGFLGVDIFFVISGFLITSLIISEYQRTGRFSIVNFYERRTRRLLPALLTVMLVSLPFAWKYLFPTQLIDFSKSLIASLLFFSNFYWHDALGEYGTESALLRPFLHTWSLAVEEQYYIIFPLIFISISRWYQKYTVVLLTIGLLLSLLFAEWATVEHASFSFYMLPSRFWELIAGGLLATILHLHPQKNNSALLSRSMPLVGVFLISYSVNCIEFDSTHPGLITLLPVLGTLLIIWFAHEKDLVTKVLSSKLLAGIGLISYSLYLWHYPIFAFARVRDLNSSVYDKFEWIILTFSLSIATYFFIEKPFRSKGLITRKTMSITLLAAIAIVGVFSFYSIQNNGLKERFKERMEVYGKNEFDNEILRRNSWNVLKELAKSQEMWGSVQDKPSAFEAEHLWFDRSASTRNVLIIGDSHSKDLFNVFYQNRGSFSDLEFARFGMSNSLLPEQTELLFNSPNFLLSDVVIISFRYSNVTVKVLPDLIDKIKEKSKKAVLVSSILEFSDIDGKPVFDWYMETHYHDFAVSKVKELFFNSQNHNQDEINESLSNIARNNDIVFLDKNDFICNMEAKTCDGITDEGYKSFFDYGHFTLEGAKYFGQRIHEMHWLEID